jgi:hypothetical protein
MVIPSIFATSLPPCPDTFTVHWHIVVFYGKEMNSRKYTYLVVKESTTCSDYILKEECYYLILVGYDSLDKAPIKGAKWLESWQHTPD